MRVLRPNSAWHAAHPSLPLNAFKAARADMWSDTGLALRVPRAGDARGALPDTANVLWWILDRRERTRGASMPDIGVTLRVMSRERALGTVRVDSVWARPSGASGYLVYTNASASLVALVERRRNRV